MYGRLNLHLLYLFFKAKKKGHKYYDNLGEMVCGVQVVHSGCAGFLVQEQGQIAETLLSPSERS